MNPEELNRDYSPIPLEREFEGWIIWQIKEWFRVNGIRHFIRAYSINEEKQFGADELVNFDDGFKAFALQFKRPYLRGSGPYNWEDLYWRINSSKEQFKAILNYDYIYYCLPMFIDGRDSLSALSKSKFWRPENKEDTDVNGSNVGSEGINWLKFIRSLSSEYSYTIKGYDRTTKLANIKSLIDSAPQNQTISNFTRNSKKKLNDGSDIRVSDEEWIIYIIAADL